jgi:hypothetical protein
VICYLLKAKTCRRNYPVVGFLEGINSACDQPLEIRVALSHLKSFARSLEQYQCMLLRGGHLEIARHAIQRCKAEAEAKAIMINDEKNAGNVVP